MGHRFFGIFATLLLAIGFGVLLTGEITDHWVHEKITTDDREVLNINAGLWREIDCLDEKCVTLEGSATSSLNAVRALTIIGIILGGLSAGMVLLSFVITNTAGSILCAMLLALLSAVSTIVGIIIYATEINKNLSNLDWSFYFAMSGGIVTALAAIMLLTERFYWLRSDTRNGYEPM